MEQLYPKVLHVDTTLAPANTFKTELWADKLDYRFYANYPARVRKLEQKLRLDFGLARQAIAMSKDYDVIFCGSEKVSIPLAMMGCAKPIVTIAHNLVPKRKAQLLNLLRVPRRWAKVGIYAKADADFLADRFGYPRQNTFNYASTPVSKFTPADMVRDGIMVSAGAASRDYPTLVEALRGLPNHHAELYASSRYQDSYRGGTAQETPAWVRWMPDTPYDQLTQRVIKHARFVVVPMIDTTQYGAGCTAVLEASCMGKAVIVSQTKGTVDYVQHGVTGLLVPVGDAAAMRAAIAELWDNPERAHQMGQAGRKFVQDNYDPKQVNAGIRAALTEAHVRFKHT